MLRQYTTTYLTALLIALMPLMALAQNVTISGTVTDTNGEPLPYANVYFKGSSKGTTTNFDGKYSLTTPPGTYKIVYQILNYETVVKNITLTKSMEVDVQLKDASIVYKEFEVVADAEDPAYPIVRKAIAKRKEYLDKTSNYSCGAYIKGVGRLVEIPENSPIPFLIPKDALPDSSELGIFYLSESVSEFYYDRPKTREIVKSSKVSGYSQGYSWNRATDILFNFYENNLYFEGLTDRGLISPIAASGMFYYRYKYEGTIYENGHEINKIKVTPKRTNDPLYEGYIFIVNDLWILSGVDLTLDKGKINFIDTLRVQQTHIPVTDSIWMPFSLTLDAYIKIFGFGANQTFVAFYSDYKLNNSYEKRFFGNETVTIEKEANAQDTAYWEETRPIDLTPEEEDNYKEGDSLEVVYKSEEYLDSIDAKNNKLTLMKALVTGYTYRESYNKRFIDLEPLATTLQYNTVEGLAINANVRYVRYKGQYDKVLVINPHLRYGLSNTHFNSTLRTQYYYNRKKYASIRLKGGKEVMQFNGQRPISPFVNTLYTVFAEENHAKLYENLYFNVSHRQELANGIFYNGSVEYSRRFPLFNTTDYTYKNFDNKEFTSNDPDHPDFSFPQHDAFMVRLGMRLRYKQKYTSTPTRKYIEGSKFPTLSVNYTKAIPVNNATANYDFLMLGLDDNLWFGLLGYSEYTLFAGGFFNKANIPFVDYKHFNGNQTIFRSQSPGSSGIFGQSNKTLNRFQLLPYYEFSTTDNFIEAHYQHHFNGFIVNKLPVLRKTKFKTVGGLNFLYTNRLGEYVEVFVGLERIFLVFRVDFVVGFRRSEQTMAGLRIGLDL